MKPLSKTVILSLCVVATIITGCKMFGANPTPPTPGGLPCDNVTPQPETDVYFRLEKVMAAIKPDAHLPTRGTVR